MKRVEHASHYAKAGLFGAPPIVYHTRSAIFSGKPQIDEALQLMRRTRKLLREAGAPKATQKINYAISSA